MRNSDVIVPGNRDIFLKRRNLLCEQLEQIPGFKVYHPSGGMFALVNISAFGCDGEIFANRLLDATGVSVVPGFAFGESVVNCVRIGFCQEIELLQELHIEWQNLPGTIYPSLEDALECFNRLDHNRFGQYLR